MSASGVRTPSQVYAEGAAAGRWRNDPAQHPALRELDRIHQALLAPPSGGLLSRLFARPAAPVRGLYYWGEVGRGKTFVVDLFYESLPLPVYSPGTGKPQVSNGKYRTHFHRFMRGVHERLREHAGEADPLAHIARRWRGALKVLVLDEFFVTDIGDAMLLARLLERMFAEGVTLVTTSNTAPENLYRDGLQRASFLPAIALLQQHCVVLRSDGQEDYRLRALTRSPVYRAPLDAGAEAWLAERWRELSGGDAATAATSRSTAARSRCAAAARASSGSTSPPCATARAAPPTTSRSRASSTPCCWAASRAWARATRMRRGASSTWSTSCTTARSTWSAPPTRPRRTCTTASA